eukprot:5705694-Prymnesium_polylepis.1
MPRMKQRGMLPLDTSALCHGACQAARRSVQGVKNRGGAPHLVLSTGSRSAQTNPQQPPTRMLSLTTAPEPS